MNPLLNRIGTIGISFIILSLYITSLSTLETNRSSLANSKSNVGMWDLPPIVLSMITGEFSGIAADLLVLDAGTRVGATIEKDSSGQHIVLNTDFDHRIIHKILKASQSLDPAFQQTYMVTQGWLPWVDGFVDKTNEILRTAQKHRSWDFFPAQFQSFNTYYFLNDYVQAGKILLKSATLKNAPPHFGILGARLTQKGGDTRAAIALMQSVIHGKDINEPGYDDLRDRLAALQGVLVIEQAITQYQKSYPLPPKKVGQLVDAEFLLQLPDNPYDMPYCINQNGDVFFDRPNCRDIQ